MGAEFSYCKAVPVVCSFFGILNSRELPVGFLFTFFFKVSFKISPRDFILSKI